MCVKHWAQHLTNTWLLSKWIPLPCIKPTSQGLTGISFSIFNYSLMSIPCELSLSPLCRLYRQHFLRFSSGTENWLMRRCPYCSEECWGALRTPTQLGRSLVIILVKILCIFSVLTILSTKNTLYSILK